MSAVLSQIPEIFDQESFNLERWSEIEADPFLASLEHRIEILSPSNTRAEIEEKRRLCFEAGADEVWIVAAGGEVAFFNKESELTSSSICPEFPAQVVA